MFDRKSMITAAATVLAVAGLGYAMQNGSAFSGWNSAEIIYVANRATASEQTSRPVAAKYLPSPPSTALTPFVLPAPDTTRAFRVAALTASIDAELQSDARTRLFLPGSCGVSLTALPETGAMVRLTLNAPCYQSQRITISHAGLDFADVTDVTGNFSVGFPALNEFAPFAVTFADGTRVEAKTLQLSLAGYQRVAVSWAGKPVLRIHAMEYGAQFGDAGHVWAEGANNAMRTNGGILVQLGNPNIMSPKLAEIYSLNSDKTATDGSIKFRVEAELNAQTCSRDVTGTSFQLSADGTLRSVSVAFSLPKCGGESGYLLLNNLFQDLKIARN